jgi:hypothetical protein
MARGSEGQSGSGRSGGRAVGRSGGRDGGFRAYVQEACFPLAFVTYHFGEPGNLHAKNWLHWDWNGRHLSNSSMSRNFVQIDHNFPERRAL